MTQKLIMFDVETGSQPPDVLAKLKPEFVAPSNYKDKDKIAANIAEQEKSWLDRAALDAITAKVLVVGILEDDKPTYLEGSEKAILEAFWLWLDLQLGAGNIVAGFCIFRFDLVMLYRRAIINGVPVKLNHFRNNNNRYWRDGLVDIAEQWQLGNRDQYISLDMLARVLGVGAKNGDGKDFAALYATDRVKALAYLHNDLLLAQKCYQRMNPI